MCHTSRHEESSGWCFSPCLSHPQGPAAVGQGRQGARGAEQSVCCISRSLSCLAHPTALPCLPLGTGPHSWGGAPPFQQGLAN